MIMLRKKISIIRNNNRVVRSFLEWDSVAVFGFSARNKDDVRVHFEELGITPEDKLRGPIIYWIDPKRITFNNSLYVIGDKTSGEVEVFIGFDQNDDIILTVASDHTDRELEKISISKSKQICDKVVQSIFWKFEDIKDHVDEIEIGCKVQKGGKMILYQKKRLNSLLPLDYLLNIARNNNSRNSKVCLLSGTVPLSTEKIIYGDSYIMWLYDPVFNKRIEMNYRVFTLPDI